MQLAKMLCNKQIGLQDTAFGMSFRPKTHTAGGSEFRPTFAAVSHIKPASQYVAGLIAELVGQPGVGTALVTVRRPAQASWTHGKLPHRSPGPASGPCRKPAAGRATCRRKPESDKENARGAKSQRRHWAAYRDSRRRPSRRQSCCTLCRSSHL